MWISRPCLFFLAGTASGMTVTIFLVNLGFLDLLTLRAPSQLVPSFLFATPARHQEPEEAVQLGSPGDAGSLDQQDQHFHHDQDDVARQLYQNVSVLCWVMTCAKFLDKRAKHVQATWGKHCNTLLFVSDEEDKDFPAMAVGSGPGREHLTARTMNMFQYLYQHRLNDSDWFLKADDDTYVIVENLRYMLSNHDTREPIFFGQHLGSLSRINTKGYFTGGAGYVISREALRRFGTRPKGLCATDTGGEDVKFSRCMKRLGVKPGDSRDALGRSRFHALPPERHLLGKYASWYLKGETYGAKKGAGSMSDYPISFHYVSPDDMHLLEYFVYHVRPYGIHDDLQDLNPRSASHVTMVTKETSQKDKGNV